MSKKLSTLHFFYGLITAVLLCCNIFFCHAMQQIPGLPPMSKEEYEEFVKFMEEFENEFNKLPKEVQDDLNKKAEAELRAMNIDPKTLQPIVPVQPGPPVAQQPKKPQPAPEPEQQQIVRDCSQVATHSSQQASCLLNNTITKIDLIRQKLTLLNIDTGSLQEWLSALAFYCKSINKPEHLQRIVSETFDHLFELITQLETALQTEEPLIMAIKPALEASSDDPYTILGLPYDATEEHIKKQYEDKIAANSPETIRQELMAAGLRPEKIEDRVQQAKLRIATITDAYERLHDTNLRQQIDRYRQETLEQEGAIRNVTLTSLNRLYEELKSLIDQGLIQEMDQFLARYAPTELALKQQMETAENLRYDQQRSSAGLLPTPSPSGGGFNNYFQPSYYPEPNYYQPGLGFTPPATPSLPARTDSKASAGGTGGEGSKTPGGEKKAEKKPDAKKKTEDTKKKETDKKKKLDKKEDNSPEQLQKDLKKQLEDMKKPLKQVGEFIEKPEQEALVKKLKNHTKAPVAIDPGELHNVTKQTLTNDLLQKFNSLAKLAERIKKAKAQDKCRSMFTEHAKAHKKIYDFLESLIPQLIMTAKTDPKLVEQQPWHGISMFTQSYQKIMDVFTTKPTKEETGKKETSNPGKITKPTKPTGPISIETPIPEETEKILQAAENILKSVKRKLMKLSENSKEPGSNLQELLKNFIAGTWYKFQKHWDSINKIIGSPSALATPAQDAVFKRWHALMTKYEKEHQFMLKYKMQYESLIKKKTTPASSPEGTKPEEEEKETKDLMELLRNMIEEEFKNMPEEETSKPTEEPVPGPIPEPGPAS